ncbi:MAG TPA: alpha/beta hydrolase [Rhizobiales bacterium]|nr:alpha/beta hydrolase [Hyphomicrobiales bacterium]
MKRPLIYTAVALAAAAGLFLAGPQVAADTTLVFDPAVIGGDPEGYLARTEAAVAGIRPELAKEIVWADPATKARTPVALVYVHGFSASKGEVRPLADRVAAAIGANLFYTRLTGHGQDGAAMANGSVNAWVNDYAEALAIARTIGERVVVIGVSTGASLASWAATQPGSIGDVAGLAMISPNYGVQAAGAEILTMPWGAQIARLVAGAERGFTPVNDLHAKFWTTRYPIEATLPMAALTKLAYDAQVETTRVPALFLLSDKDTVVRPELTREIAARWCAPHEIVTVEESGDPYNHVIAGDALSPSTTEPLAAKIVEWIKSLGLSS